MTRELTPLEKEYATRMHAICMLKDELKWSAAEAGAACLITFGFLLDPKAERKGIHGRAEEIGNALLSLHPAQLAEVMAHVGMSIAKGNQQSQTIPICPN